MSENKKKAIDSMKSIAVKIAEEYGTDIEIEINVNKTKGIAKVKIMEYCN